MNKIENGNESSNAQDGLGAGIGFAVSQFEGAHASGRYHFNIETPYEHLREYVIKLQDKMVGIQNTLQEGAIGRIKLLKELGLKNPLEVIEELQKRISSMCYVREEFEFNNLVTTVGGNDMLDKYLAGSAYTATWFLGLISSVSYSAVALGDTMASHAGWLEAGAANVPLYSQAARPTAAWAAASAKSKAFSSALAFTIVTTGGTVKGCFLTSVATKDGTTGTLFSAGLFTGGDKVVTPGDTLNVSYTATV